MRARAEPADGLVHPELHRGGAHRLDVLDHALPPRARLDELGRDERERPDRDPEQDLIEVGAALQGAPLDVGPVAPERGETRLAARERFALDELIVERRLRPAREPADVDEGAVLAGSRRGLPADDDPLDGPPVGGELEAAHAVEELEADASPPQHLVERRDHRLAHPRAHLVEDRAAVAREHAHHPEEGEPRAGAVSVAEREVVERAHEAARQRRLRGAVPAERVAELDVVERLEIGVRADQAVAQGAYEDGAEEVEDDPQAPEPGVELDVGARRGPILSRRGAVAIGGPPGGGSVKEKMRSIPLLGTRR
ncbi:hypothetical protein [Sorangium sp. So ce861]|uniref:hypothetical protein n=1 Tax=Sorangium sp. So ce861 TaxID=3133323 RepID=UPI003F60DF2A